MYELSGAACAKMNAKYLTDDARYNMTFLVKWKNAGHVSVEENYVPGHGPHMIAGSFNIPEIRNWDSFKARMKGKYAGEIQVTYFDSENDEIPIESQCEFDEVLKYCEKKKSLTLIVEKRGESKAAVAKEASEKSEEHVSAALKNTTLPLQHTRSEMPPMKLDVGDFGDTALQSLRCNNGTQSEGLGDTAPKWFTNYMETMKDEIVTEVSKRVTKSVMDALKRESQYESATLPVRPSDYEYLVDSDIDERVLLIEQESSSNISGNHDKKAADTCSRSGGHRFESSRRRYRHAEKQRKKHSKSHGSPTPNLDEIWQSPSLNRRRGEKAVRNKREFEEATRAFSENPGRSEAIATAAKGTRGAEEISDEEFDNADFPPCRKMTSSGMRSTSFTSVSPADCAETAPILKLRLANPYNGKSAEPEATSEEKVRMGCSVTGQDLLERPNGRVPNEYCALSDSDNISIISNVSHYSEMQRINNSFEMILQRSSSFADEVEGDRAQSLTTEFPEAAPEIDDPDNTRDSSSFELLSEPPPSPPLSIHMDEDHFAPGDNETSNYNINDETSVDKRGNQSKIDKCPYAIDAHGKIYQQNIMDGAEECADIILEKRTGGTYSFVGEALPGSTKESVILTGNSDSSANQTFPDAASSGVNKDSGTEEAAEETPPEPQQPRGNFTYGFHESTQSFHSHTTQQPENGHQEFSGFQPTEGRNGAGASPSTTASSSHIFVDHNASQGLGDTKRSTPRKQPSAGSKSSEDCRWERARSNRKPSEDSHCSANRNAGSRHDRSRRFGNWSTRRSSRMMDDMVFDAVDPLHILPETLVTGAVHVASTAYTTARRVYDKILTAQMRKGADRSQSKFGRR